MARKLRDAAEDPQRDLPDLESIRHNIFRWESGGGGVSERYRHLYCRVFGRTEWELFGIEPPARAHPDLPPGSQTAAGEVTTSEDANGNCYLVLVLPPGPQRIAIDIIVTDAEEPSTVSQPVRRLKLVGE
jgi:hypothetical protein